MQQISSNRESDGHRQFASMGQQTHPSLTIFIRGIFWFDFGRIPFEDVVRKVLIPSKFSGLGWIKLRGKQSDEDNHAKKVQQNLQIFARRAPDRNWCKISLLGQVKRISNRSCRGQPRLWGFICPCESSSYTSKSDYRTKGFTLKIFDLVWFCLLLSLTAFCGMSCAFRAWKCCTHTAASLTSRSDNPLGLKLWNIGGSL